MTPSAQAVRDDAATRSGPVDGNGAGGGAREIPRVQHAHAGAQQLNNRPYKVTDPDAGPCRRRYCTAQVVERGAWSVERTIRIQRPTIHAPRSTIQGDGRRAGEQKKIAC